MRVATGPLVLFIALFVFAVDAYAQDVPPDAPCIGCHVGVDGEMTLPSGEVVSINVDLEELANSVHSVHVNEASESSLFCTDCHNQADYVYPHRPLPVDTLDNFAALTAENCQRCHSKLGAHNPGHLVPALYGLNDNLPTCTDCHGGHDVAPAQQLATDPIGFCESCHQAYEDPAMADLHAQIVSDLGPGQDCQTCHTDSVESSVNAPTFNTAEQCVTCHSLLTSDLTLNSGETVSLHVTGDLIADSVHGDRLTEMEGYRPLLCVDCHDQGGFQLFPHDVELPEDERHVTIEMSNNCQKCHEDIFAGNMDSIHGHKLAEGNLDAATCVDCHGAHDIQPPDEPRQKISQTCGQCHATIAEQYVESVHGAALFEESNPDVPTCVDCHGVHGEIEDPTTALFRLRSPEICAKCHANDEMMEKYDISTDVFDTYVTDFHGTTVTIFEQTAPDQETNKAVCYDCHGVHNILAVNDENSMVIKQNLLVTCQQCHPDANANFPDTWTSHFRPSLEHHPLIYFVDLFYAVLIPAVVGGFGIFVATDVYRRFLNRRGGKHGHEDEDEDDEEDDEKDTIQ
ncbi:MAG: cytochrome c3 family protein [Caldilineaceae bacterium]